MDTPAAYHLPNSPSVATDDPLSVLPDLATSADASTLWPALKILLGRAKSESCSSPGDLIAVMDDIVYTCHNDGKADFTLLRSALDDGSTWHTLRAALPHLVDLALYMPALFPSGTLEALSLARRSVTLSQTQVACLLVHSFFGTFATPEWNDWGGVNLYVYWFPAGVETTCDLRQSYIAITLAFFQRIDEFLEGQPVTFSLATALAASAQGFPAYLSAPLIPLSVNELDEPDDDPPLFINEAPRAQLVGAHRNIGFGPAGTQEERVFAAAPALRAACLLAPPLAPDCALVVSGGAQLLGRFTGHLRSARLRSVYSTDELAGHQRIGRSWIFMDAAEIDAWVPPREHGEALPDLHPDLLRREMVSSSQASKRLAWARRSWRYPGAAVLLEATYESSCSYYGSRPARAGAYPVCTSR